MTPILFITCRMRAVTLRGSRRMTLLLILLLWRFTSVHSVSACNVHPVHWRLTWSCGFPRKINHTFGVFITDDGKTSSWKMEKHHIRLLVEEKRRTNHHFHFLLKRPKQCFHANWRLLTFFLENYLQFWLLLLPTRNSPFRLLEATVFMQQFKKKIWSLKAKTQAQCKKRVELASLSTVTQLVQMIYFVSEKMYQSTKKCNFFERLWSVVYLRPLLFPQVRMMGQKRRWLSGLTIIKTQHFACRLTSMVKMPSNWVELMIAYGVFL